MVAGDANGGQRAPIRALRHRRRAAGRAALASAAVLGETLRIMAVKTLPLHALLAVLLATAPVAAHSGAVHSWVDDQGVTHLSNVPRAHAEREADRVALTPAAHARAARSAIYKYRDGSGVVHYTDQRPVDVAYTLVQTYCPACDPRSTLDWRTVRLYPETYQDEITAAARRWRIDPALVRAVIHAESAFNPEAISRAGAQGLMQLMPATAGDYGVTDAFDVHQNIEAGTRHLAELLARYRGDIRLATAAYNAGAGAVERHGGVPPFAETRVYVERVGILHRRYRGES
jgi:soluble lytic murein transglycosylase-like protein